MESTKQMMLKALENNYQQGRSDVLKIIIEESEKLIDDIPDLLAIDLINVIKSMRINADRPH